MSSIKFFIARKLSNKKMRYLIAGGWNTVFGYVLMIVMYETLKPYLHYTTIALPAGVIAISMSFLTYKLFVFRTKGPWLIEWMRSFVTYGVGMILSILLSWVMLDYFFWSIYIAQAVSTVAVFFASYFGHLNFTFKEKNSGF